MVFKRQIISLVILMFALVVFNTYTAAQGTSSTDKPNSVKRDGKRGKHGRREMRGKRGRHGKRGQRGRRGRRGSRRGGNRALRGITLNDSQKTQLQTLFQSSRANRKKGQNTELRKLMMARRSGLATEAQKKQLTDTLNQRRAARKANRAKMSDSIRSVLTAEQQVQYDKNIADGKKHMKDRKKRREERMKRHKERRKKREESKSSQEDG